MVKARRTRGATRKPVRKQRQPIAWQQGLRHFLMMSLLVGFVLGGVWLQQEDNLPILHVTVDGKFEHVNKNELVKAVTPYVTGSFLSVNVSKLREAGEALPWVQQIQVKRRWPDSLHLVVEEQYAIAQWGQNDLVNNFGELFSPAKKSFPTGLAKLQGPDGSNKAMTKHYIDVLKQFSPLGLQISKLEMDKRRAWTIRFDNGMNLMLGRANSEQRLARFVTMYETSLKPYEEQIYTVDMRYTNGLSVVWKSGRQPKFNGTV